MSTKPRTAALTPDEIAQRYPFIPEGWYPSPEQIEPLSRGVFPPVGQRYGTTGGLLPFQGDEIGQPQPDLYQAGVNDRQQAAQYYAGLTGRMQPSMEGSVPSFSNPNVLQPAAAATQKPPTRIGDRAVIDDFFAGSDGDIFDRDPQNPQRLRYDATGKPMIAAKYGADLFALRSRASAGDEEAKRQVAKIEAEYQAKRSRYDDLIKAISDPFSLSTGKRLEVSERLGDAFTPGVGLYRDANGHFVLSQEHQTPAMIIAGVGSPMANPGAVTVRARAANTSSNLSNAQVAASENQVPGPVDLNTAAAKPDTVFQDYGLAGVIGKTAIHGFKSAVEKTARAVPAATSAVVSTLVGGKGLSALTNGPDHSNPFFPNSLNDAIRRSTLSRSDQSTSLPLPSEVSAAKGVTFPGPLNVFLSGRPSANPPLDAPFPPGYSAGTIDTRLDAPFAPGYSAGTYGVAAMGRKLMRLWTGANQGASDEMAQGFAQRFNPYSVPTQPQIVHRSRPTPLSE